MSDDDATVGTTLVEHEHGSGLTAPTDIGPEGVLLPGEMHHHPDPYQYVLIAVFLCAVTAVEVLLYYADGTIATWALVTLLLALAFTKFVTVAMYYMHLKTDAPVFRRFFILGGVGALIIFTIALTTLHIFSGGAWSG
jgi:heme/copper-type cytochrome/quinol oxidase subunit 4